MHKVRKYHNWSSGPPHLPERLSCLTALDKTGFRWVLNYLQWGKIHSLAEQSLLCSSIFRIKKLFLIFRWNFLCKSFCPLPIVLLHGSIRKSLAPPFGHLPLDTWRHWQSPLSVFSGLSSHKRGSPPLSPLNIFVPKHLDLCWTHSRSIANTSV